MKTGQPSSMMPSCQCFARRVNGIADMRKPFEPAAQAIEITIPAYCAWGCFSGFCVEPTKQMASPQWEEANAEATVST
jgi:hypothetical protein